MSMSNAAAIEVGHVYYSGNSYDPHLDEVLSVTDTGAVLQYLGREKSGCAPAAFAVPRHVDRAMFEACYYRTYDDLIAARVNSGPTVAGLCRATLPGDR